MGTVDPPNEQEGVVGNRQSLQITVYVQEVTRTSNA